MHTIAINIIKKFGGFQRTADILNLKVSWVYRWTYPKARGGTNGIVPQQHQQTLLTKAAELGVDLQPADFFDIPNTNHPPGNGGGKKGK